MEGISITITPGKDGKPQWTFHKNGAEVRKMTREEYIKVIDMIYEVGSQMGDAISNP